MKIGVIGAGGRMGRLLVQLCHEAEGMAVVPESDLEAAIEAAEECPGECIFIEA